MTVMCIGFHYCCCCSVSLESSRFSSKDGADALSQNNWLPTVFKNRLQFLANSEAHQIMLLPTPKIFSRIAPYANKSAAVMQYLSLFVFLFLIGNSIHFSIHVIHLFSFLNLYWTQFFLIFFSLLMELSIQSMTFCYSPCPFSGFYNKLVVI